MGKTISTPAKPTAAPAGRRAMLLKLDPELRNELDALATTRRKTVQQLGVEAICDLLRKYGRPVSLRDALRQSTKQLRDQGPGAATAKAGARRRGGASKQAKA